MWVIITNYCCHWRLTKTARMMWLIPLFPAIMKAFVIVVYLIFIKYLCRHRYFWQTSGEKRRSGPRGRLLRCELATCYIMLHYVTCYVTLPEVMWLILEWIDYVLRYVKLRYRRLCDRSRYELATCYVMLGYVTLSYVTDLGVNWLRVTLC